VTVLRAFKERYRNEILFPSTFSERASAARRFDVRHTSQQPSSEAFCLE